MPFQPAKKQLEAINNTKKNLDSAREKAVEQQSEPEQQPPSMVQKASNFARASAKYAASGFKKVSAEVKEGRMAICKGCQFMVGEEDNPACNKCGCPLNVKTEWATESCPMGKWSSTFGQSVYGGCGSCGKKKT